VLGYEHVREEKIPKLFIQKNKPNARTHLFNTKKKTFDRIIATLMSWLRDRTF